MKQIKQVFLEKERPTLNLWFYENGYAAEAVYYGVVKFHLVAA